MKFFSIKLDKIKAPNSYKRSLAWQRPTLTGGEPPTTIGAKELNFRVRYGNGCDLFAIATRLFRRFIPSKLDNRQLSLKTGVLLRLLAFRPIRSVPTNPKPEFV